MVPLNRSDQPIRVGVLIDEPLCLEGIATIFEDRSSAGYARLAPVVGTLEELSSDPTLTIMVVNLNHLSRGVQTAEGICLRCPGMQLIVIGPEENDKLAIDLIAAGVRAYLDLKASPQTVRQAVEWVIGGHIWAPRRVLSRLIDRLLKAPSTSHTNASLHLTEREHQVLDQIFLAHSNREIAEELGIAENTVQAHIGNLMRKTGADNRIELLMRSSDGIQTEAINVTDRRKRNRRLCDRIQAGEFDSSVVNHK